MHSFISWEADYEELCTENNESKMNLKIIKPTPFGPLGIIWSFINDYPKIVRILISKPDLSLEYQVSQMYPYSKVFSTREVDAVAKDIQAFLLGEDISFPLDLVNMDQCSEFQRTVLVAEHQIPRGKVSSYKLIAKFIGEEKEARAVGNALSNNPFPLIIPCHRVVRSDGQLGGFQGGLDMKRALLENEGINFDAKGKVPHQFYLI